MWTLSNAVQRMQQYCSAVLLGRVSGVHKYELSQKPEAVVHDGTFVAAGTPDAGRVYAGVNVYASEYKELWAEKVVRFRIRIGTATIMGRGCKRR